LIVSVEITTTSVPWSVSERRRVVAFVAENQMDGKAVLGQETGILWWMTSPWRQADAFDPE
jgi:hypothetical protein